MPGHRSHHHHPPHHRSELKHRSPPSLPVSSPPQAEVRCLTIRYASLDHRSYHKDYNLPYVRRFHHSNRGMVTDLPTSGVVGRNNLQSLVQDKLTTLMNREFANWKFIGAERSQAGPPSNSTPWGYSERKVNVYIERRQ
ncbi:uncharacterized protein EAF01_000637 [Botrytis porri]|uniref:uncharacterized protein n=1 Tax=Botrytis porri TaxID=87229 RepID=UPI0019007627|nr:uncharacterized protein EAF01_000637 [Botrytis porri]KAF7914231.1 hypothetical protein EAF01_000637 [Botrytis porri]